MAQECCKILVYKTEDGVCLKISGEGKDVRVCCDTANEGTEKKEENCCR